MTAISLISPAMRDAIWFFKYYGSGRERERKKRRKKKRREARQEAV